MTEPWRHKAACRGRNTDYWFPRQNRSRTFVTPATQTAIAICKRCPVAAACLAHALDKPEIDGIWGGMTFEQRRALRPRKRVNDIEHGTKRGYEMHLVYGLPACDGCERAHADYSAARRRIRSRAETRDDIEGLM